MIGPFVSVDTTTTPGHADAPQLAGGQLEVVPGQRRPGVHAAAPPARPADPQEDVDVRPKDGNGRLRSTPVPGSANDLVQLLSLLAEPTRLRILHILAKGERPVVAMTKTLRLPQPTVSHHLAWLRIMDLVIPRRQGKHIFYSLGPNAAHGADGTLTLSSHEATVIIRPRTVE